MAERHGIRPEIQDLAVPIGEVLLHPRNARRGDVDLIAASLERNGQYRAIGVRKQTRHALFGNHTLQAALALGWTHIAAHELDVPDDHDADRILLVDNRSNDVATYDQVTLGDIVRELPDLEGTGFTAGDVEQLIAYGQSLSDPPPSEPPEPGNAVTKPGDLVELGGHRLYCGDARDADAYAQLMGPDRAQIVWTDPPYGVNLRDIAARRGRDHGDMIGDDADPMVVHELCRAAFEHAHAYTAPGAAIYVAHADTVREPVYSALVGAGFYHAQTLIWIKDTLVLGRQDYQWRHEPILYGWRSGDAHTWNHDRAQTTIAGDYDDRSALEALTQAELVNLAERLLADKPGSVIHIARPRVADNHPTSKPVDLVAAHLRNSSAPGDIVLDPFAGSGSTLIAAEQQDRLARLVELDAGYCDVIVERWEELTDRKAKRPRRRRRKQPTQ